MYNRIKKYAGRHSDRFGGFESPGPGGAKEKQMALDYAESIVQLLANLVALLLCLFHYISVRREGWA